MGNVIIKPVKTKSEMNKFFNLPRKLYKDDSHYVEPLKVELTKQFNRKKNPFFKHGDIQSYLALRGGNVIGRITAIQNMRYNEFHKDKTGFFGYFECIDDTDVAQKLFESAESWLKERGLNIAVGPLNFSMNDDLSPGILISGFEYPPYILMAHALPYYANLLESAGYIKATDVLAFKMPVQQEINKRIVALAQKVEKTRNIKIRFFDPKNFWQDVEVLKDIYNSAWEENWGFVPFTDEEFYEIAKSLKKFYIRELVQIAEINGKPVGWSMTLPNINEALKHLNGRLFPIGVFKLLYWMKRIKGLRLWGLGIKPQYRKRGVDVMFYYHTMVEGQRLGYTEGELSWVLETNTSIINAAHYVMGEEYKRYRIFQKNL